VFPNHFSFYPYFKCNDYKLINHANQLNNIAITALSDYLYVLIISDVDIKNNIATSITHIHIWDRPIIKTIHHTTNITLTKAELFAIRCGIN